MVAWIQDFSDTYQARTGVYPGMYKEMGELEDWQTDSRLPYSNLYNHRLVDDVHGQQRRLRVDEPSLDRTLLIHHRYTASRLVVHDVLAVCRLWTEPWRPR